jgi:hypothetical protein
MPSVSGKRKESERERERGDTDAKERERDDDQAEGDEDSAPVKPRRYVQPQQRNCPYLDTVNRAVLDFDFEKVQALDLGYLHRARKAWFRLVGLFRVALERERVRVSCLREVLPGALAIMTTGGQLARS